MSIFDKIPFIGNKNITVKSAVPYHNHGNVESGSFVEYLLGGSTLSARTAMDFYAQSSAVAIAIDKIASEIEQIRPVLELENGDLTDNHPVLDMINNPNGFETRDEFIGQVARHYLLTHDSIVYAEGSLGRPPVSIWSVSPREVSIQESRVDGYPSHYMISNGIARGNYLRDKRPDNWIFADGNLRQVYQIRGFSSKTSNTFSDSPLEAVALEVRQQLHGRYHNLRLLQNGARLSLIAIFKDELDNAQIEVRRQALNEHLGGAENAGKIAVVNSEDMVLKEVGTNNKDMDYINLDKVAVETIARRYNIPMPLISNDASTFNNLEKSVYQFYDMSVLPVFGKCYSGLSDMLLPRYGLDPAKNRITYNANDIDALRMRRIEELSKLMADRTISTNEYREEISLDPVDGGDDILAPAALIPIATSGFSLDDVDDPENTP